MYMIRVFEQLDAWVAKENVALRADGLPGHRPCELRILGQTALLLADTKLHLAATQDVDVRTDCDFAVRQQLETLLVREGLHLDPVGHEAWMPRETEYRVIFDGVYVRALIAEPDFVLLSKAAKAPAKNRALLVEYLAQGPSQRFLQLAATYEVDLEALL